MNWSNSAIGFIVWIMMGTVFLVYEKKRKPKYKFAYQFLRLTSFSALLWANLLLVLNDKATGTIVVYILTSLITTIMTIREYDKE